MDPSSRTRSRDLALVAGLCFFLALLAAAIGLYNRHKASPALNLKPVSFSALKDWPTEEPSKALAAFTASCAVREIASAEDSPLSRSIFDPALERLYGTWNDWKAVCHAAAALKPATSEAQIRSYFEQNFTPVAITAEGTSEGLFTGYYEPELAASPTRTERFNIPLLARPPDLVAVDLGDFRDELKGQRIAGRVVGHRLEPYETRAGISEHMEKFTPLALYWTEDPVATFFLHIQGSGRLRLPDGKIVRVGYDGQNGHPYKAIGKTLIDLQELSPDKVSLQTIREWLKQNPDRMNEILFTNQSYIFFKELDDLTPGDGPLGAQNVPLTPERSLAVDLKYHALGAPVWLELSLPPEAGYGDSFHHLVVTQDTGGAIRGPTRGDIFWGAGAAAENIAGLLKNRGKMFLFIPKKHVEEIFSTGKNG